jgi:diguanylate cyclase (GGDEF)-like protein
VADGVVRETSAATTGLVVRFVRGRGGPDAVADLLARAGVDAGADELCDPSRWFSYADRIRLFQAMVDVLEDEEAPYELGATAARSGLNPSVVLAVRAFGSPRQVFQQLPRAVSKFTTTSTMRVRSSSATRATIDYELHDGYEHSRLDCRYAQGLIAAVPTVFGLPPAKVVHDRCESDGHPVCTYEVSWERRTRRPWRRRSAQRTELRALREQLAALQSAASDLTSSDDLTVALERIVARAGAAVLAPAYLCVVTAPEGGDLLVHHAGLDPEAAEEATSTLRAGRPLSNAVVVPVATARRHHGHLAAIYPSGQIGIHGDRQLLGAYARHAGAALDQLWAFDALRRDGSRARSLLQLAHELAATDDAGEVAELVVTALLEIVDCPRATVLRWDPDQGELRAVATAGSIRDDEREALLGTGIRPDDTPELVEMLARRVPTVLDAAEVSPVLQHLLDAVGVDRLVAVPLTAGDTLLGVATVGWPRGSGPEVVAEDTVERLQGVAEQAAAALHNARLLEEVRHRSLHDALTGLPNRLRFGAELDARLRDRGAAATAVLYGDLDGFKPVNDEFGHAAGDELLRQVAARLSGAVRPGDLVARLSGDEFAIVVEVADLLAATSLAERVVDALATPYRVDGRDLRVTVSIGIALHDGPGGDGDRLLRSADAAMYVAKQRGRNQVVAAGSVVPVASGSLGDELATAIADGEVRAHYQPVVELVADVGSSCEVTGVEALARWHHPRLGTLAPAAFLPLAEQRGLVVDLDLAVLRDACRSFAAALVDRGAGAPARHLAVNVSAVTLLDERLLTVVREARGACDLAPGQLVLEVTENRSLVDLPGVVQRLTELRRMGVRISLDDFGTGYSTLTWLQGLPIDQIKIDRSFVAPLPQEPAAALVRGVVALGRELSLEVVAEGVEREDQLVALRAAGCRRVQGYLFGRPTHDLAAALCGPGVAVARGARR